MCKRELDCQKYGSNYIENSCFVFVFIGFFSVTVTVLINRTHRRHSYSHIWYIYSLCLFCVAAADFSIFLTHWTSLHILAFYNKVSLILLHLTGQLHLRNDSLKTEEDGCGCTNQPRLFLVPLFLQIDVYPRQRPKP